jgi:hypothetical protein
VQNKTIVYSSYEDMQLRYNTFIIYDICTEYIYILNIGLFFLKLHLEENVV